MRDADPRDLGLKPRLPPFLLGFLAASFQVYLLREFAAEFYGNELIFGLFLGSWLLWGGLGSLVRPARSPDGRSSRIGRALRPGHRPFLHRPGRPAVLP